jgi:hypothetical protein
MNMEYSRNVILELYAEGDIDDVFVEQLVGFIKFDEKDCEKNLTDEQIVRRTVELVRFFTKDDDFVLLKGGRTQDGLFFFSPVHEGPEDAFRDMSLPDDLQNSFVLRKSAIGKIPDEIPKNILEIVA